MEEGSEFDDDNKGSNDATEVVIQLAVWHPSVVLLRHALHGMSVVKHGRFPHTRASKAQMRSHILDCTP